jgi:preprotein translocase subunit SecA
MILRLAKRALGFRAKRRLARYDETAGKILARACNYTPLSATALRERAEELRRHAIAGTPLDNLIIETFALVREAARRALGEQHVAAQLIGGLALHDGCIAEMKTGEGKTLTATLVCALNALPGHGVHVATPNDYLAERDANWMRPIYQMLGLSVGVNTSQMDDDARREAYRCDITYGVASEFGFDYLRDNMKFSAAETVQRGHAFALVDEADAVLIDEAAMPLALFGPLGEQSGFYQAIDAVIAALQPNHYEVDDRRRVALTDAGYSEVERGLRQTELLTAPTTLHDLEAISLLHHVVQSLRAHVLLARDRDYIVQHDGVIIIDKLTGRPMPGRRYDEGLHQALEAKEDCAIGEETSTLASITFQTLFRRYAKLAGMTGTAIADEAEYRDIYGLEVVSIPTHRPLVRVDEAALHATTADKMRAILRDVERAANHGQPVLIGAPSIEQSETLATMLEAHGWKQRGDDDAVGDGTRKTFAVLNAKHHAREARIVAQAGAPGAVTIATAMAGRGTDIRLGGATADAATHARAIASGGLLVIGTAHHDHCRLDGQLRGRAGRQGDPGRSVIHASLQDELLNTTATAAIPSSVPGSSIASPVAHRLVRAAQKRHESRSFDRRLSLLRFDAVIQRQRDTTYDLRREIRDGADPLAVAKRLRDETIGDLTDRYARSGAAWDIAGLDTAIRSILTLAVTIEQPPAPNATGANTLAQRIRTMADRWMQGKIDTIGEAVLSDALRRLMMALIDQLWSEQSERLEHLKRSIGDRRLPPHKIAAEFQIEAFALFELMMRDFRHEVTAHAMRIGISTAA